MNDFDAGATFDRIVSVEMFEHMTNWQSLLRRVHGWLRPDGRLFLHVFSHRVGAVPVRHRGQGGLDRPALLHRRHHAQPRADPAMSPTLFEIEADWRWNGDTLRPHRARLAGQLRPQRGRRHRPVLRDVYGAEAALWKRRWRLFFLATAGLFGHAGGDGVGRQPLPAAAALIPDASMELQASVVSRSRGGYGECPRTARGHSPRPVLQLGGFVAPRRHEAAKSFSRHGDPLRPCQSGFKLDWKCSTSWPGSSGPPVAAPCWRGWPGQAGP